MVKVFSPAFAPLAQISTRWVPAGQADVSLARKLTTFAPGGTTSWSSPSPAPFGPYQESLTSVPGEIALTLIDTKSGLPCANEAPGALTLPSGERLWPSTTELMRTAFAASAAPAAGAPAEAAEATGAGEGAGSPPPQLRAQPPRPTSIASPSAVIATLAFMMKLLRFGAPHVARSGKPARCSFRFYAFALSPWGRARSVPGSRWGPCRGGRGFPGPPRTSARARSGP